MIATENEHKLSNYIRKTSHSYLFWLPVKGWSHNSIRCQFILVQHSDQFFLDYELSPKVLRHQQLKSTCFLILIQDIDKNVKLDRVKQGQTLWSFTQADSYPFNQQLWIEVFNHICGFIIMPLF